jgi:hypothetical protein
VPATIRAFHPARPSSSVKKLCRGYFISAANEHHNLVIQTLKNFHFTQL